MSEGFLNHRGEVNDAGHGWLPGEGPTLPAIVYKDRANRQPQAIFAKCQVDTKAKVALGDYSRGGKNSHGCGGGHAESLGP